MSFEIQTTSYFDNEAKRLAKRHRSFIDDLQDSSIKMNVVREIIKDLGLDLEKLQSEGKLKSPNQT